MKRFLFIVVLAAVNYACTAGKDESQATVKPDSNKPSANKNVEASAPVKSVPLDYQRPIYTTDYAIICHQGIILSEGMDKRIGHGFKAIDDVFTAIWNRSEKVKALGCEEWKAGIKVYARPMESFPPYVSIKLSEDDAWMHFTMPSHLTNGAIPVPVAPKMSAEELHYKGLAAADNGNYKDALNIWQQASDLGSGVAQSNIGALYLKGNGVQQDLVEAMKWYRLAADKGIAIAQYNVGLAYEYGVGAEKDLAEARSWYTRAADQGDIKAKEALAVLVHPVEAPPDLFKITGDKNDE